MSSVAHPKMNKKTVLALKASIEHWRENEAAEIVDKVGVYGKDCALCKMFAIKNGHCVGCPVAAKTGHQSCFRSPWDSARDAFSVWCRNPGSTRARDDFRAAARAEREFLESLLPEGERSVAAINPLQQEQTR